MPDAALLTRALAEMVRVGTTLGARPETFYGLSGFGDLVAAPATGTGAGIARIRAARIGDWRGRVADLLENRKTVVEGYRTTESFAGLCAEKRIEAPILREMHGILFAGGARLERARLSDDAGIERNGGSRSTFRR